MFIPSQGFFNQACAAIAIVSCNKIASVLTAPTLMVCSFVTKEQIFSNDEAFYKKFGCFYSEFKLNKGFFSCQYYTFFFLRRFGFIVSQVYLNNYPHIQNTLNILGTFMLILFLLWCLPFKQTSILVSGIIGETCIFFTMLFCYLAFFFRGSIMLENIIIYTVIGGMIGQFMVTLYLALKSFRYLWLKIEKIRARAILKNFDRNMGNSKKHNFNVKNDNNRPKKTKKRNNIAFIEEAKETSVER